ncbi:MAG: helix-turn-helix domain-containing protein [Macromonas sp.]
MVRKTACSGGCFGVRLRQARERLGLPQDKLGVLIGLDEGCSSARISRYETGIHEPAFDIARKLAQVLGVSVTYFYCEDDWLANVVLRLHALPVSERHALDAWLASLNDNQTGCTRAGSR